MNTFILADYDLQLRTMSGEYMESLSYHGNPYNLIELESGEKHFHVFMTTADILAMFDRPEHEGQRELIGRFLHEYLPMDPEFMEPYVEIGLTRAIRNAIENGTKQVDVARLNDDSECFAEILLADPNSRLFSPEFKAMVDRDEHPIVTGEIQHSIADELKIATVMRRHSAFQERAVYLIMDTLQWAIQCTSELPFISLQAVLKVKRFLTNFPTFETEEVKAKLQEADEALNARDAVER